MTQISHAIAPFQRHGLILHKSLSNGYVYPTSTASDGWISNVPLQLHQPELPIKELREARKKRYGYTPNPQSGEPSCSDSNKIAA